MSTIQIEMNDHRLERLRQVARELGQTPDAAAAMFIEEVLRQREFPGIQFRDTDSGRQPYVAGIRLPLWHVAMVAREFDDDSSSIADHLAISRAAVEDALRYIHTYPAEIDAMIADIEAAGDQLLATLPDNQVITVS